MKIKQKNQQNFNDKLNQSQEK